MEENKEISEEIVENIDSTNDEEAVEETDNTPTLEDYEALQKKNRELYERAKKAEALAKAKKDAPLIKKEINETQSGLSREEAILYAKGYTDDEVTLANKLAKVNGISVLEAVEDDYLKTMRAKRLKKEQSEKAALPASAGAGLFKADKPVGEMSEEEHRALFNKVMGN